MEPFLAVQLVERLLDKDLEVPGTGTTGRGCIGECLVCVLATSLLMGLPIGLLALTRAVPLGLAFRASFEGDVVRRFLCADLTSSSSIVRHGNG